jgi:nucleoside-diphosphate-sugar epimerase
MQAPVVVVTGAHGYLGSLISDKFASLGWTVIRLVRSPGQNENPALSYDLAMPITSQVTRSLMSADALVHAAYDLSLTSAADIWRVNVEGTRRLLEAATEAQVNRIVVLSSMSAFEGTSQLYGKAKLEIEAMTAQFGGCTVRPGLVYGERSGGMAGTLRKLTSFPIVPVIAGGTGVYTVWESDLAMAMVAITAAWTMQSGTISVAHPSRVPLAYILKSFAAQENRSCRLVPIPWRLVYCLLKTAEFLHLHPPFRADSVLGLVRTAPGLSGIDQLTRLGVTLHAFTSRPARAGAHEKVI